MPEFFCPYSLYSSASAIPGQAQNTVRLVVTGAFTRGMKNFPTDPPVAPYDIPVALYHALPHGLNDELRQSVVPHFFTDIGGVLARKRAMPACHASQKEWIDQTQGMDAYLDEMERMSREVGQLSPPRPSAKVSLQFLGYLKNTRRFVGGS